MGSPEARLTPDRQVLLTHAAAMWPTPDASGTERVNTSPTSGTEYPTLGLAARRWATPTAQDQSGSGSTSSGYGETLTDQAVRSGWNWPTPTAHNVKDTGCPSEERRRDPQLSFVAMQFSRGLGHPTEATSPDGDNSSSASLVLNPLFDEMLMGWPRGWTECGASVTGLSRWLQLWRFYVSLVV